MLHVQLVEGRAPPLHVVLLWFAYGFQSHPMGAQYRCMLRSVDTCIYVYMSVYVYIDLCTYDILGDIREHVRMHIHGHLLPLVCMPAYT